MKTNEIVRLILSDNKELSKSTRFYNLSIDKQVDVILSQRPKLKICLMAGVGETLPLAENNIKHLRTKITDADVFDTEVPHRIAFKTGWNAALDMVVGKE